MINSAIPLFIRTLLFTMSFTIKITQGSGFFYSTNSTFLLIEQIYFLKALIIQDLLVKWEDCFSQNLCIM